MCVETKIYSHGCSCITTRHLICGAHTDHTHEQVDNEPCPNFEIRHIEVKIGGCRNPATPDEICKEKQQEVWAFNRWRAAKRGMFVEPRGPRAGECPKGVFMLKEHICGIGLGYETPWRHMNAEDVSTREAAGKESETDAQMDEPEIDKLLKFETKDIDMAELESGC